MATHSFLSHISFEQKHESCGQESRGILLRPVSASEAWVYGSSNDWQIWDWNTKHDQIPNRLSLWFPLLPKLWAIAPVLIAKRRSCHFLLTIRIIRLTPLLWEIDLKEAASQNSQRRIAWELRNTLQIHDTHQQTSKNEHPKKHQTSNHQIIIKSHQRCAKLAMFRFIKFLAFLARHR